MTKAWVAEVLPTRVSGKIHDDGLMEIDLTPAATEVPVNGTITGALSASASTPSVPETVPRAPAVNVTVTSIDGWVGVRLRGRAAPTTAKVNAGFEVEIAVTRIVSDADWLVRWRLIDTEVPVVTLPKLIDVGMAFRIAVPPFTIGMASDHQVRDRGQAASSGAETRPGLGIPSIDPGDGLLVITRRGHREPVGEPSEACIEARHNLPADLIGRRALDIGEDPGFRIATDRRERRTIEEIDILFGNERGNRAVDIQCLGIVDPDAFRGMGQGIELKGL